MNDEQKQTLLRIARDTVEAVITKGPIPKPESDDPELNANCGCFVTLKNQGQLRGCIGQFISEVPLIELVVEMAKASATAEDPLSLRLGTDGMYIKLGSASGCFLPQVATETGWSKEEFLSYCCAHKAGLAPDAWKDPSTEVYLFTADVFGSAPEET
ncbi:MAG: AMMECR1 domain-containing protein [Planctomycetota bacterium]|jgi:AMMECR1 domain-containing protein